MMFKGCSLLGYAFLLEEEATSKQVLRNVCTRACLFLTVNKPFLNFNDLSIHYQRLNFTLDLHEKH